MKRFLLFLVIIITVSFLNVSCTTDAYDSDMENNSASIQLDDTSTTTQTDPVIIPKKD
ncbi:hypothetical protein [Flavobacterium sp. J27]|uniref:hypothetical protein n=1 Tax=Flavobacterium sp. J27 TaxID=2060419 RepID=UPI0013EE55C8|nr:hypothetical protein [Flavobacterium sp. J27]